MFQRAFVLSILIALATISGCGPPEREIVAPQPLTPLTRAEWHAMEDLGVKYDPLSFERLQLGDPSLRSDAAWNRFFQTVVVPEQKKDFPNG
ncbi:MAG TPA: hypothetical protein VGN57_09595 [Pirellulaceae bacterium]|jgi:hypothetical protein|nr:hypothetical protein [Pirellulaceae bacterium]